MKILHVETGRHLYGGAQQVIYLARALGERGIDNTLVCSAGSGVDIAARDAGIPVSNIDGEGSHDLAFAFRLRQLLLAEKPDIMHCHSRRGGDFLGGLATTGTSVPAVVSRRVGSEESPLRRSSSFMWNDHSSVLVPCSPSRGVRFAAMRISEMGSY